MIDTLTVISQYTAKGSERQRAVLLQRKHRDVYDDVTVAIAQTTVVVQSILPVFVAPSASTTHWAVVVTT